MFLILIEGQSLGRCGEIGTGSPESVTGPVPRAAQRDRRGVHGERVDVWCPPARSSARGEPTLNGAARYQHKLVALFLDTRRRLTVVSRS